MVDFLTFKSFISIDVLIVFYYMGAVIMPMFIWFFSHWMIDKFSIVTDNFKKGKSIVWSALSVKQKVLFILCFLACFIFMQILWRMMFEYLIAFMQMRDALVLG